MTQTDLVAAYHQQLLDWHDARSDSKRANKIFKENHKLFKELRATEDGRRAIEALTADPNPAVRIMVATHSLFWSPDLGAAVLDEIEQGKGAYSLDAKYTLLA